MGLDKGLPPASRQSPRYGGLDSTGSYIDLTLVNIALGGSIGVGDYGHYLGSGATVEFVTHTPHGFRTGDIVQMPFVSGATTAIFPLTQGLNAGTLSGTVSVTNGYTAITFSTSQTLATNQGLTFSGDATLQGYRISSGGTGTSFTLTGPYEGTTSSSTTATLCAILAIATAQPPIVVTGSNTFVCADGNYFATGAVTLPLQVDSTSQIPTSNVICTLDGTATVTSGSATVTTTASLENQINRTWTISGDSSDGVYTVTGGSMTSWTISPHYGGSNASGVTISSNCPPFVVYGYKQTVGTYGFFANLAAQWPGTAIWIPLMPYMSDACIQAIADEMAPFLRSGHTVIAEQGDEHWNIPGFQTGLIDQFYGNLLEYVEAGTSVNEFYAATGSALPNIDQAYTLISGHQHNVLQARFDTYNKGINVYRLFGSFYAGASTTSNILQFAVNLGTVGRENPRGLQQQIPVSGVAIAPYISTPGPSGARRMHRSRLLVPVPTHSVARRRPPITPRP